MIDSALLPYSPRLFKGFTITHERDGYWRIYSGVIQRGWARRLRDAKRLIRTAVANGETPKAKLA